MYHQQAGTKLLYIAYEVIKDFFLCYSKFALNLVLKNVFLQNYKTNS